MRVASYCIAILGLSLLLLDLFIKGSIKSRCRHLSSEPNYHENNDVVVWIPLNLDNLVFEPTPLSCRCYSCCFHYLYYHHQEYGMKSFTEKRKVRPNEREERSLLTGTTTSKLAGTRKHRNSSCLCRKWKSCNILYFSPTMSLQLLRYFDSCSSKTKVRTAHST